MSESEAGGSCHIPMFDHFRPPRRHLTFNLLLSKINPMSIFFSMITCTKQRKLTKCPLVSESLVGDEGSMQKD